MHYITPYYLNTFLYDILQDTIHVYRESKMTFYFDGDYYVADQEVYQFIYSTPYFSDALKDFLYNRSDLIYIGVTEHWFKDYINRIYLWVESDEWLYEGFIYISNPSLNKIHGRDELDLSPNCKAVFHCERFF